MAKKHNVCFESTPEGDFPIRLIQTAKDTFTVEYGFDIRPGLNYERAAMELGTAIMHRAACNNMLDNRKRGEV